MLCILKKKKYILLIFQNKSNREKQFILLMISNGEKCEQSETLAMQAMPKGHKAKSEGCETKSKHRRRQ